MNAAIRAVTRIAQSKGMQVIGFERGWEGVINNKFRHLTPRSVGGIIQLGGTMLHTARCPEFKTDEGLEKAAQTLKTQNIFGLIVIGGDGSFRGALDLGKKCPVQMIGIPATIDNDVYGTDETIGFDTAVNTAVNEIDKIRDTAISHERIFIVDRCDWSSDVCSSDLSTVIHSIRKVDELRKKDSVFNTLIGGFLEAFH
jgi:6-phosphofructokinase 1